MPRTNPEYTLELTYKQTQRWVTTMTLLLLILYGAAGVLCYLAIKSSNCKHGTPLYMDISLAAFTVVLVFWQLCLCCPSSTTCGAAFVLVGKAFRGMFESLDFFTNTQMIATAVLCDEHVNDKYVEAYKKLWPFSYLAPLVEKAHMWGLLLAAVVFRRTFMMWHAYSEGKNSFSMLSRLTGMHALRHVLGADHVYAAASEDMIFAVAHFCTDIPILYLQTSLFAFAFDYTGSKYSLGKLEMLASIVLSLLSMMQACLGSVLSMKAFKQLGGKVLLMPACVVCLIGATLLRAYFAYQCEDHVWTIFGGCVWNENWAGQGQHTILPPCIIRAIQNFTDPSVECAFNATHVGGKLHEDVARMNHSWMQHHHHKVFNDTVKHLNKDRRLFSTLI
jgi:hypothetical protein